MFHVLSKRKMSISMENTYSKIGIIGAGAWGSALAIAAAASEKEIILWAKEEEVVESISSSRENKVFLPSIKLPENIVATNKLENIAECDVILVVCPAQFTNSICIEIKDIIKTNIPIISCSKGIEKDTLLLQSEILEKHFPSHPIMVLSGPSFASEVAKGMPASLNLASKDQNLAREIKGLFDNSKLSLHLIDDIIGSQIGGIVKNVIAIGCGIASGIELGSNIHASLITQGVKEAAILSQAKGGFKETLLDFAGIGDMVLTCSNAESRNFSFGLKIGKGSIPKEIIKSSPKVVEGFASIKPLMELSNDLKIKLPLCSKIYDILHNSKEPGFIIDIV